ncbi:tectonin domain-containing protein [Streptomyces sp. M10(2022)]
MGCQRRQPDLPVRRRPGASNPWTNINGSLVRIDAGSRTNVWGVDSANSIYRYTNHDANPWIKIPGR